MPYNVRRRREANKRRAAMEQEKQQAASAAGGANYNNDKPGSLSLPPSSSSSSSSRRPLKFQRRKKSNFRLVVLCWAVGYFVPKTFLRPIPDPIQLDAGTPWHGEVDPTNDSLQFQHGKTYKIYERFHDNDDENEGDVTDGAEKDEKQKAPRSSKAKRANALIHGPETVLVGKDGRLFFLAETAQLVELLQLEQPDTTATSDDNDSNDDSSSSSSSSGGEKHHHWTARAVPVHDLGVGRPLGGRFTPDGTTLYIADALLGLTRIRNVLMEPSLPQKQQKRSSKHHRHDEDVVAPKVELVANTVPAWMNRKRKKKTNKGDKPNDDQDHNHDDDDDKVLVPESPLQYVNAVAIGPKTGKVYFTDSTDIAPDRIFRKRGIGRRHVHWDTMYASKRDLVRARPTGRLCVYNPQTDQVRVLADGLHFPNGLAVDPDETYLVMVETFGNKLLQFLLVDDDDDNEPQQHDATKKGKDQQQQSSSPSPLPRRPNNDLLRVLVGPQDVVGYLDNADCSLHYTKNPASTNKTLQCFAAVMSPMAPLHKLWTRLPSALSVWLRTILLQVPRTWTPQVKPYAGVLVVEITPTAAATAADNEINENQQEAGPPQVTFSYLQDPIGRDISHLAGVTVHPDGSKLYLGSLVNDYIGVYELK